MRVTGPALLAAVLALATGATPAQARDRSSDTALIAAVEALGAALDRRVDAAPVVREATLPSPVADRLTSLVGVLGECWAAAAPLRAVAAGAAKDLHADLPADRVRIVAAAAGPTRACATRLERLALETGRYLRSVPTSGAAMDLWPVLYYDPSDSDNTLVHDYLLVVDSGGNDTYLNNAGSNLVDLTRGPAHSAAPIKAPARGCQKFALDFPEQCQVGVALLLDAAGDDVYGRREAPDRSTDAFCTADPVVRRIVLQGAGLAGVGALVDMAGDDRYTGKTNAQGSGHLGGVGLLRDEAGNDSYSAVRGAQGYALVGGLGVLRDTAGNDVYDFYTLGPTDPKADFPLRQGPGGVIDDTGVCDSLPRMMQGTATGPGSIGVLVDQAGSDRYRAPRPENQAFSRKLPEPVKTLEHGSQGFGGDGGAGLFFDEAGEDTYRGVPGRRDGATVEPAPDNLGRFTDQETN